MGCDLVLCSLSAFSEGFNPRTHMGCDRRSHCLCQSRCVSIHAPTWGATPLQNLSRRFGYSFNPRTHMGCDSCAPGASRCSRMFQSTHPHGVRPVDGGPLVFNFKFQSTHPHGVRLRLVFRGERIMAVSIHAPTWGATDCG